MALIIKTDQNIFKTQFSALGNFVLKEGDIVVTKTITGSTTSTTATKSILSSVTSGKGGAGMPRN